MAIVDGSLQLGYKDSAWFTANPTLILKQGQIVALEQTGTYKLGDGVTQLSALTFLGSSQYTLTASEIGSVINNAAAATPNDTDLVMSVESSVAKKNTWTQIKAFLKTYYDTVYTTTSAVASQITTALSGYVQKGTLTTNYIQKATGTDTIGNSQITDNGNTVEINSTNDGATTGTDNFSYKTTSGAFRSGYYGATGYETIFDFYTNGTKNTNVNEFSGYYSINTKNRFSIKNFTTGLAKFWTEMSSGYSGFGNDYFVPNERVEIRDGNLRINDLTASQIVETDASKNLVSSAKGTAYNKNFGTTAGTVLEGSYFPQRETMVNADKTFSAGKTEVYTTTALTAPRVLTLPLANAFTAGTELIFVDEAGAISSTNYVTLTRAGSDLINGSSTAILSVQYGTYKFITDGSSKWTLLNNMAASEGTWVPTITGFSGTPTTYNMKYVLIGNQCTVSGIVTGTSNATGFTITLPFNAKSGAGSTLTGVVYAVNNGTAVTGLVQAAQGTNTLTVYSSISAGAWTSLGTKSLYLSGFTYTIQ